METNTLQTLKDYTIDLTGLSNLTDAKFVRAVNFSVDDYSRIKIFGSGKWKRDSSNHGDIARVTTSASGDKVSLESELIALEYVDIYYDGKYYRVNPKDQRDSQEPLDSVYNNAGLPKFYDYDNHHLYFYPSLGTTRTIRLSYKRAHPRFTTSTLSAQSIGIVPIDDEFLALGAAKRLTIGSNDPSHVEIRDMYERMKEDIKNSLPLQDQDTPQVLKGTVASVFKRRSR